MRTALGSRFRWLTVGDRVRYVGRGGRAELRGREGRVIAVPDYAGRAPKNVVVALDQLGGMVAPAGCWRKVPAV